MSSVYPSGVDSFTTDVDFVTGILAAESNNQIASILALQRYSAPVVNIVGFGGKADGSTDNSAALTAAIAALPSTGGTIYFPASASSYVFASAWGLSSKRYIRFASAGPGVSAGSSTAAVVHFTTTSGPLIAASASVGIEFQDIQFQWPNTFAGTVVDLSGSTGARARGCTFIPQGGGTTAAVVIGLDNAIEANIEHCQLSGYTVGIQGIATGGHFSNVIGIRECVFSSATGTAATAHISNPGQDWHIGPLNAFEMGQGGGVASAITTPLSQGSGVKVTGNWFGDTGASAVTLINAGPGWVIDGNYIGGSAASTAIAVPNSADGVAILGNTLDIHSVGVAIGTSVQRLLFLSHRSTVTTEFTGAPSSGLIVVAGQVNTYGLLQSQGTFQLIGAERRSVRAPAFASPYTPDATVAERTEMTLTGPLTVNAPTNGASGMRLVFWWFQDATGGRVVTYNAVYHQGGWAAPARTLSTVTVDVFECQSDGTTWRLISRTPDQA